MQLDEECYIEDLTHADISGRGDVYDAVDSIDVPAMTRGIGHTDRGVCETNR